MTQRKSLADDVKTLEEARTCIRQLEEKLEDAITIIVKRDTELEEAERKLFDVEDRLENMKP